MRGFAGINQWKKWRSRMDFYYYFGALLLGGLFTGYYSTEYKYIQNVVAANQTELYYSLDLGLSHVVAVVFTVVCSVYYDLMMNLKRTSVVVGLMVITFGNLLYSLRYSVYLIIGEDAMILCSAGLIVAVVAELFHVYDEDNITAKMGILCAFKTIRMLG